MSQLTPWSLPIASSGVAPLFCHVQETAIIDFIDQIANMITNSEGKCCKCSSTPFHFEFFSGIPATTEASEPSVVDILTARESPKSLLDDFVPEEPQSAEINLRPVKGPWKCPRHKDPPDKWFPSLKSFADQYSFDLFIFIKSGLPHCGSSYILA